MRAPPLTPSLFLVTACSEIQTLMASGARVAKHAGQRVFSLRAYFLR
jgi:hypothetical protein